jgi:hypothetical protein
MSIPRVPLSLHLELDADAHYAGLYGTASVIFWADSRKSHF